MTTVSYILPMPPSTNHLWRHIVVKGKPRTIISREYKQWLNDAGFALKLQGEVTPDPPVKVIVTIEGGDGFHRGRDLDNCFKGPLDLLRTHGVLASDNMTQVIELRGVFRRVKGPSRCVVTVASVTE